MKFEKITPSRIKAIRMAMEFTQERMAHEIGVTFATFNRWENGHSIPNTMSERLLLKLEKKYIKQIESGQ